METYKVGDKVGYNSSRNYFSSTFCTIKTVAKVTPTGIIILDNGYRFNKYGDELKSVKNNYPAGYLVDPGAVETMFKREKRSMDAGNAVKNLQHALNQSRCGNGSYVLTDDEVKAINQLTELLKRD